MISALFDRARFAESGFGSTPLFAALRADPVGLVDVGARWGVSELFHPVAEALDVLAFEPDPEEASRLAESAARSAPWARLQLLPIALADKRRPVTLRLLRRANNSSIFPVDPRRYDRYHLQGFELEKEIELPAVPLDEIVFSDRGGPRQGEILKLDTQGAELLVLQGAERTLAERTLCIVCEASFFSAYEGAPLFSELELHLRKRGFSFYGFLDLQQRSTRRLDKRRSRGRERFMQADAIFFKDPFDGPAAATARAAPVLVLAATLLGFFDFAMEACTLLPAGGKEAGDAIARLAAIAPGAVAGNLAALSQAVARNPDDAAVHLGRFVDALRDVHTYHEVKTPT
jgi:FkbM family methyltransferase